MHPSHVGSQGSCEMHRHRVEWKRARRVPSHGVRNRAKLCAASLSHARSVPRGIVPLPLRARKSSATPPVAHTNPFHGSLCAHMWVGVRKHEQECFSCHAVAVCARIVGQERERESTTAQDASHSAHRAPTCARDWSLHVRRTWKSCARGARARGLPAVNSQGGDEYERGDESVQSRIPV